EWRTMLRIRRADPENLRILHTHFGGTLASAASCYWYWTMVYTRLMNLLRAIRNDVSVKAAHHDDLFDLERYKQRTRRGRGLKLPQEELTLRWGLIARIKALNKRVRHEQPASQE